MTLFYRVCAQGYVLTCMLNQCTTDACDCDGNLVFHLICDWNGKWKLYIAAGMGWVWG